MAIKFAPGLSEKIKKQLRAWDIDLKSMSSELQERFEELDEDPAIGSSFNHAVFGQIMIHRFRIDRPPITKLITVAYEVVGSGENRVIRILDFVPRNP